MSKITEYNAATRFDKNDILIKDGTGGTKKISVENAAAEFAGLVSAIQHRNVYRGKNLGTTVSTAQKTAIQNGTFDDLFIGDYWAIGGTQYKIADMDYWYNCGDTNFAKHHLVMVPSTNMYTASMNDTNTTEGGYANSKMYTENLEEAKTKIQAAFGELLLTHREIITNATTDGHPSGYEWVDSTVDLMNEVMVYGSYIYAPGSTGLVTPTRYTINNSQLAIYRLNPRDYKNRAGFWLRDVVSSAYFAHVSYGGSALDYYASNSLGVRPAFAIG